MVWLRNHGGPRHTECFRPSLQDSSAALPYLGGSTPQTTTDSEALQEEVGVLPDAERVRAKPLPPGRSLSVACSLSLLLRNADDLTGAGGSSAASEATREPRLATSRSRSSKRDEAEEKGSSKKEEEAGRRDAAMTTRREQRGLKLGRGCAVVAFVFARSIS